MRVGLAVVWGGFRRSEGLTSGLLLGGFRLTLSVFGVGLELICVRCAAGLGLL